VTLAFNTTTVSAASTYIVGFALGVTQSASANAIVITFPTGANIAGVTAVTIQTSAGLGTNAIPAQTVTFAISGQNLTIRTNASTGVFPAAIGSGAVVQITVSGVINPAVIGNYNVSVQTALQPNPVASNNVTTTALVTTTSTTSATYPLNGATNVPVTNLTFTWPAISGSSIAYQFALAPASANTPANEIAILDYSDNTLTNAEPCQETLQYGIVYWWEVRAVTLNSSGGVASYSPWTIQMFTTETK